MSESSTKIFIGPAGSALSDLQPLSEIKVVEGNFLYAEEEPDERKGFGCHELSFEVEAECQPCPPGIHTFRTIKPGPTSTDTRPRTFEATIKHDDFIRIRNADIEYAGLGDKVFFVNADDVHLAKKRQYRGCNKSKFYNQYLRKRRR